MYFFVDSKDIINNSIHNYVLKLLKKRKNKESRPNQIKRDVDKPSAENLIKNNVCEHVQLSSTSGNY